SAPRPPAPPLRDRPAPTSTALPCFLTGETERVPRAPQSWMCHPAKRCIAAGRLGLGFARSCAHPTSRIPVGARRWLARTAACLRSARSNTAALVAICAPFLEAGWRLSPRFAGLISPGGRGARGEVPRPRARAERHAVPGG